MKRRNQSSDIYFIENIPKTSKNARHVLQCDFFLKSIPVVLEYLVVYGSQLTSKVGSHHLHYCEDIFFHLSQFMTTFTFEQCLSFWLLFKLAKKLRCAALMLVGPSKISD